MSLCLKNATFINWNSFEFRTVNILVEEGNNGKIFILPVEAKIAEGIEVIECSGKFVTKAFANGHHHIYSALAKGMPAPKKSPAGIRRGPARAGGVVRAAAPSASI